MAAILFVCTANICRSPIAMGLLGQRLSRTGHTRIWRVESAGTWARIGVPADQKVQQVMQEWNIDLRHHRARMVNPFLLRAFDLILVMSRNQREALAVEFPEHAKRIHLLTEMAGLSHEIADPIKGSIHDVRATAQEIDRLIIRGFRSIVAHTLDQTPSSIRISA